MAGRSSDRIQVGFALPTHKALLALAEKEGKIPKATMVQILVEEALIARGKLDPSRRSVTMPSDLESVDAEEAAKPVEAVKIPVNRQPNEKDWGSVKIIKGEPTVHTTPLGDALAKDLGVESPKFSEEDWLKFEKFPIKEQKQIILNHHNFNKEVAETKEIKTAVNQALQTAQDKGFDYSRPLDNNRRPVRIDQRRVDAMEALFSEEEKEELGFELVETTRAGFGLTL